MDVFATAGGVVQVEFCCEYLAGGISLIVGLLALRGAAKRSFPTVLTGLVFASITQVLALICVLNTKPTTDPDESHQEALAWRILIWSSGGTLAATTGVLWLLLRRKPEPPPAPPNPFAAPVE